MDVEKARRAKLKELLEPDFVCFEEVPLRHALFPQVQMRADVVAFPTDERFLGSPIAFEIKEPTPSWQTKNWIYTLRQASGYVYASIAEPILFNTVSMLGRRITAAFIYPAPELGGRGYTLDGGTEPLAGALAFALHMHVGHARFDHFRPEKKRFMLMMGATVLWESDGGYTSQAASHFSGSRMIGSRRVDVFAELDGMGRNIVWPEVE